jgi:hypothetical protein
LTSRLKDLRVGKGTDIVWMSWPETMVSRERDEGETEAQKLQFHLPAVLARFGGPCLALPPRGWLRTTCQVSWPGPWTANPQQMLLAPICGKGREDLQWQIMTRGTALRLAKLAPASSAAGVSCHRSADKLYSYRCILLALGTE